MRVPSIGLPLDERRIVREGYRLAERMMANYQDPPSLVTTIRSFLLTSVHSMYDLYRSLLRD